MNLFHPSVNLLFYLAVILSAILFNRPVYVITGLVSAMLYAIVLKGKKACLFTLKLLIGMVMFALFYAMWNHFGNTVLFHNMIGNAVTWEALLYGMILAGQIGTLILWLYCLHASVASDEIIYLWGRLFPKFSLYLTLLHRMVPLMREKYQAIRAARKGVGLSGSWISCLHGVNAWLFEGMSTRSASMHARGYGLKGRSAYGVYRFAASDRTQVLVLCTFIAVLLNGTILDQTRMVYKPLPVWRPVTAMSWVYLSAYLCLCLFTCVLTVICHIRMKRAEQQL